VVVGASLDRVCAGAQILVSAAIAKHYCPVRRICSLSCAMDATHSTRTKDLER
jgi:hypothetical protein